MPENHHAREDDDRNYTHNDGKPLPAFLNVASVLREIEFLIIKLVHLATYYTKTDYKIIVQFRHLKSSQKSMAIYDILRALLKGINDANAKR